MKKFIIPLMAVGIVVVLLLGCMPGAPPTPPVTPPPVTPPPVTPPVEPVRVAVLWGMPDPARASGFDKGQYDGITAAAEEYGWEVSHAEAVLYGRAPMVARSYAEKGYDIVIFPDAGYTPCWMEVAPQCPDTWFAMMSYTDKLPDAERVVAYSFDAYAYGTMVGVTAASITETNTIGLISGIPIDVILVAFSGAIEGAKAVNPEVEVLVGWVGDWTDVPKNKELAQYQIEQGADVIFACSSAGQKGLLEATEAAGVLAIGHMGDIYELAPATVVTSVVWDTIPAYCNLAEAFEAGTLERKLHTVGLEGFSLTDFHGMVPAEVEAEVREAVRKLKAGEIEVPYVMHEL